MKFCQDSQRTIQKLSLLLAMFFAFSIALQTKTAFAAPAASGFVVDTFASVPDPLKISFAPTGELYVGRNLPGDPAGSTRIHRVSAGGSPVVEFGPAMLDPDAVLFDADGSFASTPGSIIVGGIVTAGVSGAIYVVDPNGVGSTVIGPTALLDNPSDMTFDGTGRLLFTDHGNQDIKVTSGGAPTTLFSLSSNTLSVAYDPTTDRIYSNALDGTIRIHQSDGALIDGSFASSDEAIAVGPGSEAFGNDLYTVNNSTGELIRIDLAGVSTVIGTGFDEVRDLEFGPDGALYASEADNNRILRIAPIAAVSIPMLPPGGLVALTIVLGASACCLVARRHHGPI